MRLALCTNQSSGTVFSQVARCNDGESVIFSGQYCSGCGTTNWNAYPYHVWAKEPTSSSQQNYYIGYLNTSYGGSNANSGFPISVRCVWL